MKTRFLTLWTIVVIATSASGQTLFPKVGVSFSQVRVVDESGQTVVGVGRDFKTRVGYTFGIGMEFPFTNKFSMQPELNFVQKGVRAESGARYDGPYDDTGIVFWEDKTDLKMNYFELPILLKYSFGKKPEFFLTGGPTIALGLGRKVTYHHTTGYHTAGLWEETKNGKVMFTGQKWETGYYDVRMDHLIDLGVNIGGGVTIGRFLIDARYTIGLRNVFDATSAQKNRTVQFTIGYPLTLRQQ